MKTTDGLHNRQQVKVYFYRVGWLALDCWRNFRLRVISVVILSWLGISAATAVFGGLIFYIRSLESNRTPSVLGMEWQLNSPQVLALFTVGMLLLGVTSAAILYWVDWLIAHLAIAYQKYCTYRLFRIASDPRYYGWQRLVEGPPTAAMQLFLGTTRGTAIALRRMLGGILPTITFLVATVFLVRTSPGLTALLIPLILVYLVPLYQSNQWAVEKQTEYSKIGRKVRKGVSRALDVAVGTNLPIARKMDEAKQTIETPDYEAASVLFYARKLVNSRIRMVNAIFFVGCLVGLFSFFAIATVKGDRRWSDLLIYLFALRFAFGGLQQVTVVFGKLSRLLPIYRYHVDFVIQAEQYYQARQRSPRVYTPLPDTLPIRTPGQILPDALTALDLHPGDQVWAIVSAEPDFSMLQAIAARLENAVLDPVDLISTSAFLTESVLELDPESLNLSRQAIERQWQHPDAQPLRDYLNQTNRAQNLFQDGVPGLDEGMVPLGGRSPSPEVCFLLNVWSAAQACQALWLNVTALFKLDSEFVTAFLSAQPTRYLFLVTDDPTKALKRGSLKQSRQTSAGVMVFGNQGLSACGDISWLKTNVKAVEAYLQAQRDEASKRYAEIDDESLDDDDDE